MSRSIFLLGCALSVALGVGASVLTAPVKQSIKINGTRIRWENTSAHTQTARIVWRCSFENNSDDVLLTFREVQVQPTAVITVQSGLEDGSALCGRTCEIDAGNLTPWPPPAPGPLPEFKGLLASASARVECGR